MQLELDEVRRLTGPSLLWDHPGAIVDVLVDGIEREQVLAAWQTWITRLLNAFNWQQQSHTHRMHAQGFSFAISAPVDALYTACDLAELAWQCSSLELLQQPQIDWQLALDELRTALAEEQNPALLALIKRAAEHNVCCLFDDDELSLGLGQGLNVWPVDQLPDVNSLDWAKYQNIPRSLITGTNGKSTSVRLAAEMAKAAGLCAGVTSTDFIRVGDDILDTGDYSGPGGARRLLRDPRTEMGFLEVARGGILRRGLPVEQVNAALITNIASDHLGQYGINTVAELAEVKFVVAKAVGESGVLVLNADNEWVVKLGQTIKKTICWFSTDEQNSLIQTQLAAGERAVFIRENDLIYHAAGQFEVIADINAIPMTFKGAAVHNVQNALGVVGLCKALGLSNVAIQQGLQTFSSNEKDNPGRGNVFDVAGVTVIVDFAHNEHSMQAMVAMAKHIPAQRYITVFSHAGDRSDEDMIRLNAALLDLGADLYIPAELEKYLRGRELGEVPALVKAQLLASGVAQQQIICATSPLAGAQTALEHAEKGDVVLLFILDQRAEVSDWLADLNAGH